MAKTPETIREIPLTLGKDRSTAILGSTKVEVTAQGDVTLVTDKPVRSKPAEATAPANGLSYEIGQTSSFVFLHGAKVELDAAGTLIVSTGGTITVQPVPAPAAEIMPAGTLMKDGTIYGGMSPDTNEPMYVAPMDAPRLLDFNKASKYARKLKVGGKKGFRLPSQAELKVLADNREKGALKGTFNTAGVGEAGWYMSSTIISETNNAIARFSDGRLGNRGKYVPHAVRCVRA